jgi:DNA-binding XRE family transcriptional regulator
MQIRNIFRLFFVNLFEFYIVNDKEILIKLGSLINLEYPKYYKTKLDFASACNVDEKTIRNILLGNQNISIKILLQICSAIKLKPSEIFQTVGL